MVQGGQRGPFGRTAGAVLGLGGSAPLTLQLAQRLQAPAYRYSFVPYWHPKLAALFVDSGRTAQRARLLGAAGARLEVVGNLVADAVDLETALYVGAAAPAVGCVVCFLLPRPVPWARPAAVVPASTV